MKVHSTSSKGRHLLSSGLLAAGTLLVREKPLVALPICIARRSPCTCGLQQCTRQVVACDCCFRNLASASSPTIATPPTNKFEVVEDGAEWCKGCNLVCVCLPCSNAEDGDESSTMLPLAGAAAREQKTCTTHAAKHLRECRAFSAVRAAIDREQSTQASTSNAAEGIQTHPDNMDMVSFRLHWMLFVTRIVLSEHDVLQRTLKLQHHEEGTSQKLKYLSYFVG